MDYSNKALPQAVIVFLRGRLHLLNPYTKILLMFPVSETFLTFNRVKPNLSLSSWNLVFVSKDKKNVPRFCYVKKRV